MNKFKYGQEVYHTLTEAKVKILKVITNQSSKSSVYALDNGMTVSESELSRCSPVKEVKKSSKKKRFSDKAGSDNTTNETAENKD